MTETFTKSTTYTKYLPNELTNEIVESASIFVFDNGEVYNDEMSWFDNGKIEVSSYKNGIVKWSDKQDQYMHHYHYSAHELGQLQYILAEMK